MRNLVVGVDGSAGATHALEWAVLTVGPTGSIHAVTAVAPATEFRVEAVPTDSVAYRGALEHELRMVCDRVIGDRVAEMTTTAVEGDAEHALTVLATNRHADAIVVSTHAGVRGAPHLVGSTIRHLVKTMPCPLIVIPPNARGALGDGALVVGIGHGEGTERAVTWAARLAEARHLPLGLVRATREGPAFGVDGLLDIIAFYLDPSVRDQWTAEDLAEMADRAQNATDAEISIGTTAVAGLPATQLVEISKSASLLVIGQHRSAVPIGDHVVQPLRYALTHARCPVAVIPLDDAPSRPGS